ncbi:MAG: S8 family serine peptidase [Lentisphaerales bacterium]|nr:S8 family serine peptidase [Lentisphaerales bacterium]
MKNIFIVSFILFAALAGYLSLSEGDVGFEPVDIAKPGSRLTQTERIGTLSPFPTKKDLPKQALRPSEKRQEERILKGEKLLYFRNPQDYESFLRMAHAEGLEVIGDISKLKLVKVRFRRSTNEADFLARFVDVDLISENDSVQTPAPLINHGSVGFRDHPLTYFGISGNEKWGAGVTVAVIDSGVVEHRSLNGSIQHFDLIGGASEIESFHGTAVASLIAGESNHIKGVSPAVNLLDFRALTGEGAGDAFTVSQAIVMAVDNGARIINLSLGTASDNPALREAVLYAQNAGALLVAAVGNDGVGKVSYPAAYPGVIGVGAIDAQENYQSFSNRGPEVDVVAPGVEVKAAGLNEAIVYFTGTSAAAPLVSGTLAYQLSQNPDLGNDELVDILKMNSNDSGPPGGDNFYGEGILNVRRIQDSSGANVLDAAAAGFYLEPVEAKDSFKLTFSGENRGTGTLREMQLSLSYPGFEKIYSFYEVESSQTVFDYIEISADSRLLNGDYELILKVISEEGDGNYQNNIKTARIRLNIPSLQQE